MKVLNPDAQEFVPNPPSSAFAPKAGKQAAALTIPIRASIGAPKTNIPVISIVLPTGQCKDSQPTPNGVAELATCLSDNLTFEELFDSGSRQNSVSSCLAPGDCITVALCNQMSNTVCLHLTFSHTMKVPVVYITSYTMTVL